MGTMATPLQASWWKGRACLTTTGGQSVDFVERGSEPWGCNRAAAGAGQQAGRRIGV